MQRSLTLLAAAFVSLLIPAAAHADDTTPPVIVYTAPSGSQPKGSFTVTAKITDESKFYPQLFFRYGPGAYEKALDMKKKAGAKDMYEATIPYKTDHIEFYIEAYDDFGNGPARSGDPDSPVKVTLADATPAAVASSSTPASSSSSSASTTTPSSSSSTPSSSSSSSTKTTAPSSSTRSSSSNNNNNGAQASSGGGRTWTWIVGGVGLGLLVGGLVAGLAVSTEDNAFKTELAGSPNGSGQSQVNDPSGLAAQHDANASLGTKATILTISGAVLLAGGVVLYFVEGSGGGSSSGSGKNGGGGFSGENDSPSAPAPKPAPASALSSISFGAAPVQGGGAVAVAGHF